jgi:WD40 repeat protein
MVGGRTRFYGDRSARELWAAIAPHRGTAIVFDHRVWHDGEPVTSGVKHVLRTDVMYRRLAATAVPGPAEIGRHRGYAWRAIACRDGSIASSGRDGTVRRWIDRQPAAVHDLAAGSVTALVEAADGRLWCGTRSGRVAVIDGPRVSTVHDGGAAVLAIAALPGGVAAATAHGELVELDGTAALRITRAHDGWVWAVAIRRGVVSCGDDGRVIEAGRLLAAVDPPARALAVLPSGALLVGTADGAIHRLDGAAHARWPAHAAAITSLAVSPTGAWASSAEDGAVKLWRGDRLVRALPVRGDFVTSVAFRRDGGLIATGYDGVVWEDSGVDAA